VTEEELRDWALHNIIVDADFNEDENAMDIKLSLRGDDTPLVNYRAYVPLSDDSEPAPTQAQDVIAPTNCDCYERGVLYGTVCVGGVTVCSLCWQREQS